MKYNTHSCFFCDPDRSRVLYDSKHFYAILGLGPIIEGYVLLAAKQHIRSMLDLPVEMRQTYESEKNRLRRIVTQAYGPPIITEHGRIQVCFAEDEEARDKHCFHAHQLFFPITADLRLLSKEGPFTKVFEGSSLFDLSVSLLEDEEYLLFEDINGVVTIHTVRGKCPRQFMRYLVARSIGKPELCNWAAYPEWDKILRAKAHYQAFMPNSLGVDLSSIRSAHWLEAEGLQS
jgi:diadenosine tetraphosphate (Ap4A) HIT family hydrolase